jgi:hypothetical protein
MFIAILLNGANTCALGFGLLRRCYIAGTSCNSAPCVKLVESLSDLVQSFVDAELFL